MAAQSAVEHTGQKTLIMGIVNVTPDSFYDRGAHQDPIKALAHAKQLFADGADIVDVGGESSRPGAEPAGLETELRRVLPVLEGLSALGKRVSVDTYRAETARRALALGASMVNDITALRGDGDLAGVIADAGCECVLMHMRGAPRTMQDNPEYDDVVHDICAFFEERVEFAMRQGIKENAVWLDPGFGFGKTVAHNLDILRRLEAFTRFGLPLLVGTSNKSTIGAVLDLPVDQRIEGTAATVAIAIQNGANGVRVHDVKAMARVAKMTDAVVRHG
ncbi:MAG TPA: dihydropteroate synthase [Candidatus Hydrogenedentes bacterium]|nr:dihydropteroate synthase [Candidatus Hydrogenedentota bacterium]HIJ73705.1 dihydropteroate synthase [Candidatus Hydrogenedentota bacterium]